MTGNFCDMNEGFYGCTKAGLSMHISGATERKRLLAREIHSTDLGAKKHNYVFNMS
jgi:hypothetical protein